MTALMLSVAVAVTTPGDSPSDWLTEWSGRVAENGALSVGLIDEWRDHHARFAEPDPPPVVVQHRRPPSSVEYWRPLVAAHFRAEHVDDALAVMACESGGDPNAANPTSSARGLFQFLQGWWSGAWGYPAFDPYDPVANVEAAAWLSAGGTDWTAWVCQP